MGFFSDLLAWLYARADQTRRWLAGYCRPYCRDWQPVREVTPVDTVCECRRCGRRVVL